MAHGQHRQGGGGDRGERRAAEERHIAGAINSLHRDYNAAQTKHNKSDEKHLKWLRRSTCAAIGYTIFTAVLIALAGYSAYQTINAIEAANRAADAATKQSDVAEDTEIRSLRPYLHIVPGKTVWETDQDGSVRISAYPVIKVHGQTPAAQVSPTWKLKIDQFPMGDNFKFDAAEVSRSTAVIFSDDEIPITSQQIIISKQDIDLIQQNKKRIYMEGVVFYLDTFAYTGKARWSEFCFIANMSGQSEGWHACQIHNGADWKPETAASAKLPKD